MLNFSSGSYAVNWSQQNRLALRRIHVVIVVVVVVVVVVSRFDLSRISKPRPFIRYIIVYRSRFVASNTRPIYIASDAKSLD